MTIPNLAGVITKQDTFQKGGGSFKATYVPWAKTMQLLREHAPGWNFHLQATNNNDGFVWRSPDGSGYLVCFFSGPDDQRTSLFPFPIMDHRNMPLQGDRISSRAFTDSHRRALCASAAFHFGLAYELWADEEIKDAEQPISAKKVVAKTPTAALAREAISKAESAERCDEFMQNLVGRHAEGHINDAEFDSLKKALTKKRRSLESNP